MGYFVCQHCGAHLHDSKVEDLYQWEDDKSIGWSFVCPKCKEENYKEITFLEMEEIKDKIKQLLIENKCYVGNSEVAKMLRELANEWDD